MASTSHAVAQDTILKVNIPFAFENGNQHFAAGTYRIGLESGHMLLLQGDSTQGFVMTNAEESLTTPSASKLRFRKYGDRYFLREVWVAGNQIGYQCVKTHAEKQVQIARNNVPPSDVELAVNHLPW